jgi:hypothetical protein
MMSLGIFQEAGKIHTAGPTRSENCHGMGVSMSTTAGYIVTAAGIAAVAWFASSYIDDTGRSNLASRPAYTYKKKTGGLEFTDRFRSRMKVAERYWRRAHVNWAWLDSAAIKDATTSLDTVWTAYDTVRKQAETLTKYVSRFTVSKRERYLLEADALALARQEHVRALKELKVRSMEMEQFARNVYNKMLTETLGEDNIKLLNSFEQKRSLLTSPTYYERLVNDGLSQVKCHAPNVINEQAVFDTAAKPVEDRVMRESNLFMQTVESIQIQINTVFDQSTPRREVLNSLYTIAERLTNFYDTKVVLRTEASVATGGSLSPSPTEEKRLKKLPPSRINHIAPKVQGVYADLQPLLRTSDKLRNVVHILNDEWT